LLSRFNEDSQGSFFARHTGKLKLEHLSYIFHSRLQDFVRGTIVFQDVCKKGLEEGVV